MADHANIVIVSGEVVDTPISPSWRVVGTPVGGTVVAGSYVAPAAAPQPVARSNSESAVVISEDSVSCELSAATARPGADLSIRSTPDPRHSRIGTLRFTRDDDPRVSARSESGAHLLRLLQLGWKLACFVALVHTVGALLLALCLHVDSVEDIVVGALNGTGGNVTVEEVEEVMGTLEDLCHDTGGVYDDVEIELNVYWAALLVLQLLWPLGVSHGMLKANAQHYLKTYFAFDLLLVSLPWYAAANREKMDDPWRSAFTALPALHIVQVCSRRQRELRATSRPPRYDADSVHDLDDAMMRCDGPGRHNDAPMDLSMGSQQVHGDARTRAMTFR
tara:strand:+ start:291 stop:1292 length:1002 start_codon:yes stop_codon:yes gene_type:complete